MFSIYKSTPVHHQHINRIKQKQNKTKLYFDLSCKHQMEKTVFQLCYPFYTWLVCFDLFYLLVGWLFIWFMTTYDWKTENQRIDNLVGLVWFNGQFGSLICWGNWLCRNLLLSKTNNQINSAESNLNVLSRHSLWQEEFTYSACAQSCFLILSFIYSNLVSFLPQRRKTKTRRKELHFF